MHDKTIGWEERFADKFGVWFGLIGDTIHYAISFDRNDNIKEVDVNEILDFIKGLLATQNAEHQKLVLEEHALAKRMEQDRIVKILEGMRPIFHEGIEKKQSDVWIHFAISGAINLITQ